MLILIAIDGFTIVKLNVNIELFSLKRLKSFQLHKQNAVYVSNSNFTVADKLYKKEGNNKKKINLPYIKSFKHMLCSLTGE